MLQGLVAETRLFSPAADGGAAGMAKRMNVPFLGRIPMDPALGLACEQGRSAFGDADFAQPSEPAGEQHGLAAQGSHRQAGAADGAAPLVSSATLSSLRGIIMQLVARMEPGQLGEVHANKHKPAIANGAVAANGQDHALPQHQQSAAANNTVVHSNGDIPLDPALHYRIHLGM